MRKILLYFALKYEGDYNKVYLAIKSKEHVSLNSLKQIEEKINCNYLTILDDNYPECLKGIANPPIVLFYYGDISLLKNNNIAVIGTRKYSTYGKNMTIKIVSELKEYCVNTISGLAIGIDSFVHQESLNNNIKTIAVLGCGIDYCYPKQNEELYEQIKQKGLVISEYPGNQVPRPANFLIRNRIIAALSQSIVVIEASYKSGTMNTVAYGLEYGKDIFAIPYLANKKSGCNYLIKQGAKLIEEAKDIFL